MGLNVAKGVLTAPTSTGTQTISLPSNFDPKAIILWATYETADTSGSTGTNGDGMLAFGAATYDGATVQEWFASQFDDDATASAAEQPGFNTTACLSNVTAVGSVVDFVLTLSSMSTGGTSNVILNWTDVPASQILVHYIVLGGADITGARAGSWNTTTAVATENITVNTGFGQPDLIMFGTSGWNSTGFPSNADGSLMMGWAKSATERRSGTFKSDTSAANMTLASYQTARAAAMFGASVTLDAELELSAKASWPTDGFQISYPDQATFAFRMGYLALKGTFTATIGSGTAPTSAAPQTQNLALASGTPVGAMIWSTMIGTNAAVDTTASDLGGFMLGAADGTNQGVAAVAQDDNNANSVSGRAFKSSKVVQRWLADPAGGGPTLQSEADATISGSNVVLTWGDTDSLAFEYQYVIFGSSAAGATVTSPTMAGTGAFAAPVVSASSTVTSPVMGGTGAFAAPVVSAGATSTSPTMVGVGDIVAPAASAQSEVVAPTMSGVGDLASPAASADSTTTAPIMAGTGDLISPTVAAVAEVISPTMAGSGDLLSPTLTVDSSVQAAVMAGVGDLVSPSVASSAVLQPPAMIGVGDLVSPTVGSQVVVVTPAMLGVGDLVAPSLAATASVVSPIMLGVGDLAAPVLHAGATVSTGAMSAVGRISVPVVLAILGIPPDTVQPTSAISYARVTLAAHQRRRALAIGQQRSTRAEAVVRDTGVLVDH